MKKKVLKKKLQRKPAARKVAPPAIESAREIWLAGLGAFSVAQQESGRIIEQGTKLFDRLVAEGSKVEKKTRKDVEGVVDEFRGEMEGRMEAMKHQADAVRKQASDNWDKLEKIFEARVGRALSGLGIPSSDDVKDLSGKVQKLSGEVAALESKIRVSAAKGPAKKPAARKPARKKVAKKKVAKTGAKKTAKAS
jgi:poly(hydroxyalkanoate) granule-associated protein